MELDRQWQPGKFQLQNTGGDHQRTFFRNIPERKHKLSLERGSHRNVCLSDHLCTMVFIILQFIDQFVTSEATLSCVVYVEFACGFFHVLNNNHDGL